MKLLRSSNAVARRQIADGWGQGRGAEYKPGLRIQDVPSRGLSTRILGWKTNREHHLLSKLELLFFYLLEWSLIVCDIREQYPLDLNETLDIAKRLGIRHPTNPHTRQPVVMTTDFLIAVRKSVGIEERARTIKYAKELSSLRVIEKFEIERLYWERRDINWGIVTEREINIATATNIKWVHPYKDVQALMPITLGTVVDVEYLLAPKVVIANAPLRDLASKSDEDLGLIAGSSLAVIRYLIATRTWLINMDQPIQTGKQLLLSSPPVIKRNDIASQR